MRVESMEQAIINAVPLALEAIQEEHTGFVLPSPLDGNKTVDGKDASEKMQ